MKVLTAVIAVVFIAAVILLHEVFQPAPSAELYIETLNPLLSKSLDYVVEMNKLIISLALVVLGACAAILTQKYPNLKTKGTWTTVILLVCILLAASSIFSGYVLYDNLVFMLANNFYSPSNELVKWPQRLQFYSFFSSVVLFCLFIVTYFLHGEAEVEPAAAKPMLVKIVDSGAERDSAERN
jgi:hypothetical protein